MSAMLGNVAKGLPALLGVVGGILILVAGTRWVLWALGGIGVALACRWFGQRLIGWAPIAGFAFIELWILAAISIMALGTAGILWLTVHSPQWFDGEPEEKKDAVSGALVGAVTAYLAILWTEDISKGEGWFWPSTQFKSALSEAYTNHPKCPAAATKEHDAIYLDRVRENGPDGWGFVARLKRAKIINTYLSKPAKYIQ